MKNMFTKILCLSISFQLTFGTFQMSQAVAESNSKDPVTSPTAFLTAVQEEGEALFGPNGVATLDEKTGKIYIKEGASCLASVLGEDSKKANTLSTTERIKAYIPRAKKAQEVYARLNDAQKQKYNESCADCNVNAANPLAKINDEIPEGGLCSKTQKITIEKYIKSHPAQCGIGAELKSAFGANFGIAASAKTMLNAGSCLYEMGKSFITSLGSMAKSVWDAGVAGGSWAKAKIFEAHKPVEKAATDTGLLMSGMSDKDRELAKKDPEAARNSLAQKFRDAASWFGEWILNADVPMYKELMGCAKCGERGAALCKVIGVAGKDVVKNMILLYIGGKAIQGIAKFGGKIISSAGGKALSGAMSRTATKLVGRTAVEWGAKGATKIASVSLKAANAYTKFLETNAGKAVKAFAKGAFKIVNVGDDLAIGVGNKLKGALPSKITIGGGKKVATEIAEQTSRAKIFAGVPELEEKAVKAAGDVPGMATLDEAAANSGSLRVEVVRNEATMTKAQKQAKAVVAKLEKPGPNRLKLSSSEGKFVDDIENATKSSFETTSNKAIKVSTPDGPKFIAINESDKVLSVHPFGEGSNKAMVVTKGDVFLAQEGKIIGKVPSSERKTMEALLGKEDEAANKLAVAEAKENVIASGGKIADDANASKLDDGKFKAETPNGCSPKAVEISAVGKAL